MLCGGKCPFFCLFVCSPAQVSCNVLCKCGLHIFVSLLCMIVMCIILIFCYVLSVFSFMHSVVHTAYFVFCFAHYIFRLYVFCFVYIVYCMYILYCIVYILISCVLHCLFSFWALYFGQFVFFAPGVLFIICFVLNAMFCFCIVLCNHYCVCLKIWGTNIQVGISSLCSTGNNSLCQNIKHHNVFPRQHKWRTLKLCVHLSALLFPRGLHTI